MLTLTLDTACVIHAAQRQEQAHLVNRLVDLARLAHVCLSLTTAYLRDQEAAQPTRREANRAWLERAPVLGAVPGPFRFDYSRFDGPDVFVTDEIAELDKVTREIVLPPRLWPDNMSESSTMTEKDVRRVHDVQHLLAHRMAGHDAFVTSDNDDLVRRAERLRTEAGITVWTLAEAVARSGRWGDHGTRIVRPPRMEAGR